MISMEACTENLKGPAQIPLFKVFRETVTFFTSFFQPKFLNLKAQENVLLFMKYSHMLVV